MCGEQISEEVMRSNLGKAVLEKHRVVINVKSLSGFIAREGIIWGSVGSIDPFR